MRVLHIDDDAGDRDLLLAAIERVDPGVLHLEASGGEEAYAMLLNDRLERIDCIFLDINMPSMDGITLLRLLKDHPKLKEIPVYIHSTTGSAREINSIEKLGGYFLQKTIDFQVLVTSLKQILQPWMSKTNNRQENHTRYLDSSSSSLER